MADRYRCNVCDRWVGGGVGHDEELHKHTEDLGNHRAERFESRHFAPTVEVYCSTVDETKVILQDEYVRHCPMCGGKIEVSK